VDEHRRPHEISHNDALYCVFMSIHSRGGNGNRRSNVTVEEEEQCLCIVHCFYAPHGEESTFYLQLDLDFMSQSPGNLFIRNSSNSLNLYQESTRQFPNLNSRPRRFGRRQHSSIDLVHLRVIRHVGEEDRSLEHIVP
jgi:hypothetical protein